jgi:hypothetical protein
MTQLIVKMNEWREVYIELPDDLMERMSWNEGTQLEWTIADDGTISLRKSIDDSSTEA